MGTKVCLRCKTEKAVEEYNKNIRKPDGLQIYCRICSHESCNDHYRRSPARRAKLYEQSKQARLWNARLLARYKRLKGCLFCAESEPAALDLHHVDPAEKDRDVSTLISSRKRMKAEVRKCVVLCANCHRKHHAGLLPIPS